MNLRPSGYEPDELPSCSTPRRRINANIIVKITQVFFCFDKVFGGAFPFSPFTEPLQSRFAQFIKPLIPTENKLGEFIFHPKI